MVNSDILSIALVISLSCVYAAPRDILWNKQDGGSTGSVESLLNTPGDLDTSDSLSYGQLDDNSDFHDKHLSDLDFSFDSRQRRYDPSAFAALRGKREYDRESSKQYLPSLRKRTFRPGAFVAIRGKRTVPFPPLSEIQYQLLLRSILHSIETLSNQKEAKAAMQKRHPSFGFHALRG